MTPGQPTAPAAAGGLKRTLAVGGTLLLTTLFVYVVVAAFKRGPEAVHEVPFMLAGQPAPPFTMKRLDNGETVQMKDFIGKRPIVLNFWATWCGPCKMEQPVLDWGYEKYSDKITFIGVVFEDTEENTKAFVKENRTTWPQLFDSKSTVAVDYAVSGVPETYFIDKKGIILNKFAGPIDPGTLEKRIGEILK